MIGIYKITNPKGFVYIGQSVDIKSRKWKYMSSDCKNQKKIYHSLLKYGWVNHVFEVIHECKEKELNELEAYYIKLYDSVNNGLNLCYGGGGHRLTKEHKDKIRKSLTGKKHTPERIEKTRKSNIGKKMSDSQRKKMSEIIKFNYNFLYCNRKIVLNTENGVFYESAKEAAYCYGYVYNTFKGRLNGNKPNNTNLTYA